MKYTISIVITFVIIASILIGANHFINRYIEKKIPSLLIKLSQRIPNVDIRIANIRSSHFGCSLKAENLSLSYTAAQIKPIFEIKSIMIKTKLEELLKRKVIISSALIDKPVINITKLVEGDLIGFMPFQISSQYEEMKQKKSGDSKIHIKTKERTPLPVKIENLEIRDMAINYNDLKYNNEFGLISSANIKISNLNIITKDKKYESAEFASTADTFGDGEIDIKGNMKSSSDSKDFDARLTIKNINLADISKINSECPFSGGFFNCESDIVCQANDLTADTKITLQDADIKQSIRLGAIPVQAIASLAKEEDGSIELNLVFGGDLNHPEEIIEDLKRKLAASAAKKSAERFKDIIIPTSDNLPKLDKIKEMLESEFGDLKTLFVK